MNPRSDNRRHAMWSAGVMAILFGVTAGMTHADEVRLRNGRTLEIAGHSIEGELIRLSIEGGGEIVLPVTQVLEIRRTPARPAADPVTPVLPSSATHRPDVLVAQEAGPEPDLSDPGSFDRETLRAMAAGIARRHAVDEKLVLAVIEVESHYDARAVSPRGAVGLMQLMPQTASRFDVRDPYDPVENVDGGVRYLRELLDRYSGQVRLVLAAYNAGEDAVEKHSGIPPYRETIQYVSRVLRAIPR